MTFDRAFVADDFVKGKRRFREDRIQLPANR
jgi:hypothetical protein